MDETTYIHTLMNQQGVYSFTPGRPEQHGSTEGFYLHHDLSRNRNREQKESTQHHMKESNGGHFSLWLVLLPHHKVLYVTNFNIAYPTPQWPWKKTGAAFWAVVYFLGAPASNQKKNTRARARRGLPSQAPPHRSGAGSWPPRASRGSKGPARGPGQTASSLAQAMGQNPNRLAPGEHPIQPLQ